MEDTISIITLWVAIALVVSWALGKVWPDRGSKVEDSWQQRLHKFLFGGKP